MTEPQTTCGSCATADSCSLKAKGETCQGETPEETRLRQRMAAIRHKILVFSGKGGVGKSTVAVNLAAGLARKGYRVGLLDVDFHGPSVPKLLGLGHRSATTDAHGQFLPIEAMPNLYVMSLGCMLEHPDQAMIWRGPMKIGVIQQLLRDVEWGPCDYLIIDSPPGTGDEPLSVAQLLSPPDGAVIVTTPQELALADVRKSVTFCRQVKLPVLGIVENMSGFVCPNCGETVNILKQGGGEELAETMQLPFLGRIPMDPDLMLCSDDGQSFTERHPDSPSAKAMGEIVTGIEQLHGDVTGEEPPMPTQTLRIAIPTAEGKLCMHFGHCQQFAIVDVNPETGAIISKDMQTPPPHEPGVLPAWLGKKNVNLILAGGMGSRAQQLFAQNGIQVVAGAPALSAEELVAQHIQGRLQTGANACDH